MVHRLDTAHPRTSFLRNALTCGLCGARRDCSLVALVQHARRGWPRCCGEVMVLTPDQDGPASDEIDESVGGDTPPV